MEKKVWVMLYHHRHGIDFSVYASAELAWRSMAQICLEALDDGEFDAYEETEGVKSKVAAIINDREGSIELSVDECDAIMQAYIEIPHSESFDIEERGIVE